MIFPWDQARTWHGSSRNLSSCSSVQRVEAIPPWIWALNVNSGSARAKGPRVSVFYALKEKDEGESTSPSP